MFGGGQNWFSGDWLEFENRLQSNVSDERDVEVELGLDVSCTGSANRVLNAVGEVPGGIGDPCFQSGRPEEHSFCKRAGCGFNAEVMKMADGGRKLFDSVISMDVPTSTIVSFFLLND